MPYGKFKTIAEVATTFDINVAGRVYFTREKELKVLDPLLLMMEKNLNNEVNYVSEYAICDALIRPILGIAIENYPFNIWSHVPYNVDEEKGLVGEPDYLIAAKTKYGTMAKPSLCVIEAKKDNFSEGWTQALAEMVASSILGAATCYGIVTTGDIWQFGKLDNDVFIVDPKSLSATTELKRVLDTINWLFFEISKQAKIGSK
jgi:hypothetical protein